MDMIKLERMDRNIEFISPAAIKRVRAGAIGSLNDGITFVYTDDVVISVKNTIGTLHYAITGEFLDIYTNSITYR
jgi:hypothetical protein